MMICSERQSRRNCPNSTPTEMCSANRIPDLHINHGKDQEYHNINHYEVPEPNRNSNKGYLPETAFQISTTTGFSYKTASKPTVHHATLRYSDHP
ncbi:hypothetical protein GIB67_035596 [Kingdonia uniflora]|uniref:Uncharacterized protein n=1 Tax=Kingdonia uniflora TaxID=39325 RepID=A0A7J7LKV8_9MAGN|nr:hypothetical protein GIB67_035596 [Kingdonia uniflora]